MSAVFSAFACMLSAAFPALDSIMSAVFSAFASILSAVCSCGLLLHAASEPRPSAIERMVVVFMGSLPLLPNPNARDGRGAKQQYAQERNSVPRRQRPRLG